LQGEKESQKNYEQKLKVPSHYFSISMIKGMPPRTQS